MACETWREQLDAYLDGELAPAPASDLKNHVRSCGACAGEVLERVQLKRAVAAAGKRYEPSAQLRARIARSISSPQRRGGWQWAFVLIPAALVLILSVGVNFYAGRENSRRLRSYSELADQHVSALASSTPVDVLSSDRHTVKPWFQGKIPFTFNLPELEGSDFTLLGGRVAYFHQTPGAHLIYQLRKHDISVFIFPDRGSEMPTAASGATHVLSFNVESWTQDGLRYFVLGDASAADIAALSKLLRGTQ